MIFKILIYDTSLVWYAVSQNLGFYAFSTILRGWSIFLLKYQDPLRPLVLGGDHSISFPVVRAVSEKLGGSVDILHLDAHPDIYHEFEGNKYSHASSFARIMEGGYARRLLQVTTVPFFLLKYQQNTPFANFEDEKSEIVDLWFDFASLK